VAGAIQLFRRECYEEIGGHHFARYGGEDTICEIIARMKGWSVYALPECIVFHHKTGTMKRGVLGDAIRQGKMDYALGTHLVYESLKCVRRLQARPCFRFVNKIHDFYVAISAAAGERYS
jgi:hypothetical protein